MVYCKKILFFIFKVIFAMLLLMFLKYTKVLAVDYIKSTDDDIKNAIPQNVSQNSNFLLLYWVDGNSNYFFQIWYFNDSSSDVYLNSLNLYPRNNISRITMRGGVDNYYDNKSKNTMLSLLRNSNLNYNEGRFYLNYSFSSSPSNNTFYYLTNINIDAYSNNQLVTNLLTDNYNTPVYIPPSFTSPTDLSNMTTSYINGSYNDYDIENENLYVHILEQYQIIDNVYYYNDKVFNVSKNSKYYTTFADNEELPYFSIPFDELGLNLNTQYYYAITNFSDNINNTTGVITTSDNIYEVVSVDTTNKLTAEGKIIATWTNINNNIDNTNNKIDETNNKLDDVNNNLDNISQQNQQFYNNILDDTVSSDTNNDITSNLDVNNQNSELSSINSGFFSRLTSLVSNLTDYNLNDVDSISIPVPFSNENIILTSDLISSHIPEILKNIFSAFWFYIFFMYMYKFINKIYISISTGNILSGLSSNDEVITNNML